MIQMTYTSKATQALASGDIFKIVENSSRNNLRNDLTGFLIFSGQRFFQLIEGPKASVDDLLENLYRDLRHENVEVQTRKKIEERAFPKWRMKRISPAAISSSNPINGLDNAPDYVDNAVKDFLRTSALART